MLQLPAVKKSRVQITGISDQGAYATHCIVHKPNRHSLSLWLVTDYCISEVATQLT